MLCVCLIDLVSGDAIMKVHIFLRALCLRKVFDPVLGVGLRLLFLLVCIFKSLCVCFNW